MKATKLLVATALLGSLVTFALAGQPWPLRAQQAKAAAETAKDAKLCVNCNCSCPGMRK